MELGDIAIGPVFEHSDDERRRAAQTVREMCTQHVCSTRGPCQDVNHRRDLAYTNYCLEMLGLTDVSIGMRDEEGDERMNVPRQAAS